jgi:hypothetical protein
MLKTFAESNGCFAFLVKNIVIKNVIQSQQQFVFPISDLRQIDIDAKREQSPKVSLNSKILL